MADILSASAQFVVLGKFRQRGSELEGLGRVRSSSSAWQRPGLRFARGCDAKILDELVLELKAGPPLGRAALQKGRASSMGQLYGSKAIMWLTAAVTLPLAPCCISLFEQYLPEWIQASLSFVAQCNYDLSLTWKIHTWLSFYTHIALATGI